jgi:D-mannose binding lectin.
VTHQGLSRRIWDNNCGRGTQTFSAGGGAVEPNNTNLPEPAEYDRDHYDVMLNQSGSNDLNWLAGDHWRHAVPSSGDRVMTNATWSSYYDVPGGTGSSARYLLAFQEDGNLVKYYVAANGQLTAQWATGTDNHWDTQLRIQGDGNLVIWDLSEGCLWASNLWGLGIDDYRNGHEGNFYGYNTDSGGFWFNIQNTGIYC